MPRSAVIKAFLALKAAPHLKDLYTPSMEVQVQVAQDEGTIEFNTSETGRKSKFYTNGVSKWYDFRMPKNANSKAVPNDFDIRFDFEAHVSEIGCTGWDFVNGVSRWVGFDFDSMIGHKKEGLSSQQLNNIVAKLSDIPWVTIQNSTSGNGLHIYVFLEPYPTANHMEHAALARSILGLMSGLAGEDFEDSVDVCGHVLWIWSRRATHERSFKLIKDGSVLPKSQIPPNWKEHLNVVKGSSRRTQLGLVPKEGQIPFDSLTSQYIHVPLDDQHTALMKFLKDNEHVWWWDQEKHMLITHTLHLKEAHECLGLKGDFDTNSSHSSDQNCFCFPMKDGAWVVRRFSQGVNEHKLWDKDASGWTRTYLNKVMSLESVARLYDALEHPKGGYFFNRAESAVLAAEKLGLSVELHPGFSLREVRVFKGKDGKVVMEMPRLSTDNPGDVGGWIAEKSKFTKVLGHLPNDTAMSDDLLIDYDDFLRHLVGLNDTDQGWVVFLDNRWRVEPLHHIRILMESRGLQKNDVTDVLGQCISKAWRLVNEPFKPEYPGNRKWNRDAAKLRFEPDFTKTDLRYPTWSRILNHCGRGLDEAVENSQWCQDNDVKTGGEYLFLWVASMFQFPERPLPFLFFYGDQNTGKSTFHESLQLLFDSDRGYGYGKQALLSKDGFNGELANAILCVVEEVDLSVSSSLAYNRIKEWVTNKQILIHPKGEQTYMSTNLTHWVQCANNPQYCPVFPDDTRIVVIGCEPLNPTELIPRFELVEGLEKEAQDFITALMSFDVPRSGERLNVPVINTDSKEAMQAQNMSLLEAFVAQECKHVPGAILKFSDFYQKFGEWLDNSELTYWTKIRVSKSLPLDYPTGAVPKYANQKFIGNLQFNDSIELPKKYKMICVNGKLEPKGASDEH